MSDAQAAAVALAYAFADAWASGDPDQVLSYMAPDAAYQNVPTPTLHGHDQIRTFITPNLLASDRIEFEHLNVVADEDGRRVFTERVDTFFFPEGKVAVPVMGIYEIENGKIARWRDYADIGSFLREMSAIGRGGGPLS